MIQENSQTIGFIGAGHLTDFMIRGLRRGGFTGKILLTPRSKARAEVLAEQCQCEITEVNDILKQATIIGLAVRPQQVEEALSVLQFENHHVIISYIAGLDIARIKALINPDTDVIRCMPISAAAVCASPSLLYPKHQAVEILMDYCGKSIVLQQESDFDAGSVVGCVYASFLDFYANLSENLANLGMDDMTARKLIYGVLAGAVAMASDNIQQSAHQLASEVAVEGTYSKICLDSLKQANAFEPWKAAMQQLFKKLT